MRAGPLSKSAFPLARPKAAPAPRHMTLDAEQSCAVAAGGVERGDPFTLARFGDGDLYCMKADTELEAATMLHATLGDRPGRPPLALADGEEWSEALRDSLRAAWETITTLPGTLLLGDPKTSGFGLELFPYWDTLAAGISRAYVPVHHEMFWLSDGLQPELRRFCQAVRDRQAPKLLVGRSELAPAAHLLQADFVAVDPFGSLRDLELVVGEALGYPMVLLCAGRGGKAMQGALMRRTRTVIDLGSLFDPLYIANSRPRQGAPSDAQAEAFFTKLAGEPVTVSPSRPGRAFG